MGMSPRTQYILLTSLVLVLLAGLIIGLTVGLQTPPLADGGSPPGPPRNTTTESPMTFTTAMDMISGFTEEITDSPLDAQSDEEVDIVIVISNSKSIDDMDDTGHKDIYNNKNENYINKENTDQNIKIASIVDDNNDRDEKTKVHAKREISNFKRNKSHKDRGVEGGEEWGPQGTRADAPWPPSVTKSFKYAAVATDTVPCSTIGADMLGRGGSAVDAAVAAGICIGVVNHHNSGIGGGHFMTIYQKPRGGTEKELNTVQAREWAPLASTQDMFVNNTDASSKGGLAIAVPGEVKGFYLAWERYGVLPWADLFQPSIQLCEQGFIVERSLSGAIRSYEEEIRADPNLSELFVKDDGTLVREGDLLKNPKLGNTFSRIAADPHTFYNGSLADDIVADLADYGSIITKQDLLAYRAKWKPAIAVPLSNGNLTAYSVRPPASGVVIEFMLNVLNGYYFVPTLLDDLDDKITTYHRILEAYKFAYAKRSSLGDEDFVDVEELLTNLTSPEYGEYIRSRINDNSTQNYTYYEPDFDIQIDGGTCHMSVQTSDGSAVAMTLTINLFFGSNVRGNRTGIMFNDEMDDFSTPGTVNDFGVPASPANYIVPGKMPMSSMCPTLIVDNLGNIVFSTGASGGTRITTATAFVAMQSVWFNQTLSNATDTPRIHHQLMPEDVKYEPHLPQEIIDGLKARNHLTTEYGNIANVQSIHNTCPQNEGGVFTDHCIYATADGRKGGAPDGMS